MSLQSQPICQFLQTRAIVSIAYDDGEVARVGADQAYKRMQQDIDTGGWPGAQASAEQQHQSIL